MTNFIDRLSAIACVIASFTVIAVALYCLYLDLEDWE